MSRMSPIIALVRRIKVYCLLAAGTTALMLIPACEKPLEIEPGRHLFFTVDQEHHLAVTQFLPGAEKHPEFEALLPLPADISDPASFEILAVVPYGKTNLLLITRKHGLLYTRHLGESWERVDNGLPPEMIWPFENHGFTKPVVDVSVSRNGSRIALLFAQELYLSYDAGRSFQEAPLSGGFSSIEYLCVAWHPDNPKLLLVGTALPGRRTANGAYYSADGGETIIGIDRGLPGEPTSHPNYLEEVRAVAWGQDENTFYAGLGNGGGVYKGDVRTRTLTPIDPPEFRTYPDGDFTVWNIFHITTARFTSPPTEPPNGSSRSPSRKTERKKTGTWRRSSGKRTVFSPRSRRTEW